MAYNFGETYNGLFGDDFDAIYASGNDSLKSWLDNNMVQVPGESFYIYRGDGDNDYQFELADVLLDNELFTVDIHTFTYLRSTWQVDGF